MTVTLPRPALTAGDRVGPIIREAIADMHPDLRSVAEYHRGWVTADGTPSGGSGGKCIRGSLAMLSAEQWGDEEAGLIAAAAVELVHDFSLLHDDIMDGDRQRRGRATAWVVFGVDRAILAGDGVLLAAQRLVMGSERPRASAGTAALLAATAELIDGQARDMALERSGRVDVPECIVMSRRKTSSLIALACYLGATLAGAPPDSAARLRRYGMHLGLAFQAVDDLLGIWGDERVTGKPAGSDLQRGKRTLPVTFALDGRDGVTPETVSPEDIEQLGGRNATEEFARDQLDQALHSLNCADVAPDGRAAFEQIARFVVEREL